MRFPLLIGFLLGPMLLGNFTLGNSDLFYNIPNSIRITSGEFKPSQKDRFDNFWTPENEIFLTVDQREVIDSLKKKVLNGKDLTIKEKQSIIEMKKEVIKLKLGDEKYLELERLIEKRQGSEDLTMDERLRLYELNKEATLNKD